MSGVVLRLIEKRTRRLADQAVWFTGARQWVLDLPDEPISADLDIALEHLLAQVSKAEEALLSLRELALENASLLAQLDGRRNGEIRDAWRDLAKASADAFEAAQDFRWAVMEYEASNAPRLEGWRADSREAAMKMLEQIQGQR